MNFNFSMPETPDELEELNRKLEAAKAEADVLAAKQRQLINEQNQLVILIREARKRKEEEARLKALEEERQRKEDEANAVRQEYDDLWLEIEAMEVFAWNQAHTYQKEDILAHFHAFKNEQPGFFNANDLGLGKTIESIATLNLLFKENPEANAVWLTKSSILKTGGTAREIKRWSDINVFALDGSSPKEQRDFQIEMLATQKNVILLTNYETVRTSAEAFKKTDSFKFLVMDEVHKLKGGANSTPTALWKAVKDFAWAPTMNDGLESRLDFIMMLSGTPMVNRVAELWAYLHIFDPVKFHSLRQFETTFNAYIDYHGKVDTGKILDICLKDRMVRRRRDEVGIQLPDFQVIDREVDYNPEQLEVYNQMKNQFYVWLDEQEGKALTAAAIIAQLTRLRQISVWPVFSQKIKDEDGDIVSENWVRVEDSAKIDEAMEIIEDANDQVVVFSNFNSPMDEIQRRCKELNLKCEIISGATSKYMDKYEVGFQNGEIDVLCINNSMGEGLNLQKNPDHWTGGSATAIHLDLWWTPARFEQCNGRIHRQGQTQACTAYVIHAPGTIDDFVRGLMEEKDEMFKGIMESKEIRPAYQWMKDLKEVL